jgi:ABC-type nitrate/sulfonate/bicarbonate transport system ATPase subunit
MTLDNSANETKPAIRLRQLRKSFVSEAGRQVAALDGVDVDIPEGSFVTLIGPTGCGKTTTLNLVAGLEHPDSGEITFNNGLVPGRTVACVFQHYTLFPWRNVVRNVAFGLQMQGVPKAERNTAALELLEKVGLTGFERAYPHELSGGMRQRAAIAQALAVKPKLLLMDEPFGALDDPTRKELHRMLIELWRESGITILFVTHNLDEAITLADKVVVLSERPGRVIREYGIGLPRPRDSRSREFVDTYVEIRRSLPSAFS